jgi:dGTPase
VALNLNESLTEAICLAHDLGHTPFGHAGQDALNECMREYGGFEHNLQSCAWWMSSKSATRSSPA